jgi:hypothetical protein
MAVAVAVAVAAVAEAAAAVEAAVVDGRVRQFSELRE